MQHSSSAFADTKPHYALLDGLRGVAALMVVIFHISEALSANAPFDYGIGHGYLAVDFFFILSGFVVGYAYDDRLNSTMTRWQFYRRRLIRLQPMVVMGTIIGAICFYFGAYDDLPLIANTSVGRLLLLTLLGCCMIPILPSADCRGYAEMYPINGPAWSLFFEYIAYVLYALIIRRLSNRWLMVLIACAAIGLGYFAIDQGFLCYGFSLDQVNFVGGMLKVTFSFSLGLLLSRTFKPQTIRGAFGICSIALIALLAVPHIGDESLLWLNGIYEIVCVMIAFPVIVLFAASGKTTDAISTKICTFLGDISFPLYMIHYPFLYVYLRYYRGGLFDATETAVWAVIMLVGCVALAYACVKLYDEPLRRKLAALFLKK